MENNATSTNIQPTSYGPDTVRVGQVWYDRTGVGDTYKVTEVGTAGAIVQVRDEHYPFAWGAFARMTLIGEGEPTTSEKLAEAYHLIFDAIEDPVLTSRPFADRVDEEDALFRARSALAEAIRVRGENRPERFDGDGRTYENGGLR